LGYILGDFLTNSSGHPAAKLELYIGGKRKEKQWHKFKAL
jgi:hypothetical protein